MLLLVMLLKSVSKIKKYSYNFINSLIIKIIIGIISIRDRFRDLRKPIPIRLHGIRKYMQIQENFPQILKKIKEVLFFHSFGKIVCE